MFHGRYFCRGSHHVFVEPRTYAGLTVVEPLPVCVGVCFVFCVGWYLLPYLSLRDNKLSGAIPESLGNLVNLEELWLNANQIEGE